MSRGSTDLAAEVPGVDGDPHIHTFEGQNYLLLNQGNFDLLHISGLKTKFMAQNQMKKVDIDWQIYTHYSGTKSFTKGLLFVDKSGGKLRQTAELTSKDCQWRTKMPGGDWELVKESKLFSVPDDNVFVTGTNLALESQQMKLSMNTKHGKKDVAGLLYTCRPGHYINLRMRMSKRAKKHVQGGLSKRKSGEVKAAMLQTASGTEMKLKDEEFSVKSRWQELGGSFVAASYFEAVDAPAGAANFLASCDGGKKEEAAKICSKHLGEMAKAPKRSDRAFFADCVTDVCNGAGEVAAELAAELQNLSRK